MELFRKRIQDLKKLYPGAAFFFRDNISRIFLTGFSTSADPDGILFVHPDGSEFYIDSRYIEDAKNNVSNCKVIETNYTEAVKNISETISKEKIKTVYFDGSRLTYNDHQSIKKMFKGVQFKGKQGLLNPLRMIKDNSEIVKITKAIDITAKVFSHILAVIKPGVSETDIEIEMNYQIKKLGGQKESFSTIVLFGEKTSLPHGVPEASKKLKSKDIVLLDFGVLYENYVSDITRTFFIGEPDELKKKIYSLVLNANEKVIDKVRTDMSFKKVDALARDLFEKSGYSKYFIHSLGHGIGLEVHEYPVLSHMSKKGKLKGNMVFTDEPGLYFTKEFGVRIEDDILITADGGVNLSCHIPKEMMVL